MLKIGMVVANDYAIDSRVQRQAEALVGCGHAVTVVALGSGTERLVRMASGVTVVETRLGKYRGRSMKAYASYYLTFGLLAARELRHLAPLDVVVVHSMPEALVFSATRHRIRGGAVVLDVHDITSRLFLAKFGGGPIIKILRAIERGSLRVATTVITVHEAYAQLLEDDYGLQHKDVGILVNVPDPQVWMQRPTKPWSPETPVYAYHGTLAHRFGVTDLVEAFALLREDIPAAKLLIFGDGDAREDVRKAIQKLNLQESVTLSPGAVPGADLPRLLEQAHIGVAPSRADLFTNDALPTKVMEWAALGMPVVATRLRYLERVFGNALLYVTPDSPADMARGMRVAAVEITATMQRVRMANDVVQRMDFERQIADYCSLITRVGDASRRRP